MTGTLPLSCHASSACRKTHRCTSSLNHLLHVVWHGLEKCGTQGKACCHRAGRGQGGGHPSNRIPMVNGVRSSVPPRGSANTCPPWCLSHPATMRPADSMFCGKLLVEEQWLLMLTYLVLVDHLHRQIGSSCYLNIVPHVHLVLRQKPAQVGCDVLRVCGGA